MSTARIYQSTAFGLVMLFAAAQTSQAAFIPNTKYKVSGVNARLVSESNPAEITFGDGVAERVGSMMVNETITRVDRDTAWIEFSFDLAPDASDGLAGSPSDAWRVSLNDFVTDSEDVEADGWYMYFTCDGQSVGFNPARQYAGEIGIHPQKGDIEVWAYEGEFAPPHLPSGTSNGLTTRLVEYEWVHHAQGLGVPSKADGVRIGWRVNGVVPEPASCGLALVGSIASLAVTSRRRNDRMEMATHGKSSTV